MINNKDTKECCKECSPKYEGNSIKCCYKPNCDCLCHTKAPQEEKSECCRAELKEINEDKICVKCHKVFYSSKKKDTSWEERFEKEFTESDGGRYLMIEPDKIKDFINKEIQKAKEDTIKEVEKYLYDSYAEYDNKEFRKKFYPIKTKDKVK